MASLAQRPEAPWGLAAGIAGAIAATVLSVKAILDSPASSAAVGFVVVPFLAAALGVIAGIWGLAAGCVWQRVVKRQPYLRPVIVMAWVVALGLPAAAGWEVYRGLALERAVAQLRSMDAAGLEQSLERSGWRDDRFFVGALAQHPRASPRLLERIAALPDPQLYDAMGTLWDVMERNRKGLAVMRLVVAHPNVTPGALEAIARNAEAEYVLGDVLAHPKTPLGVLERHSGSTQYLLEWGLALNPNTPPAVMERLARSGNLYTRVNLTRNRATPSAILEGLARDPDAQLASSARQALEQRARPGRSGR